jgi:hypothetical protein
MILNCSHSGCQASILVLEDVSPEAKYICREHAPPGKNDIHFQLYQFEHDLGSGADPRAYEQRQVSRGPRIQFSRSGRQRKKKLERTRKLLAGHENADEIMKILEKEKRDSNS